MERSRRSLSQMEDALIKEAQRLAEEGVNPVEALLIAAATIDGAGESATVLSRATCTDIAGNFVPGLTGGDSTTPREDEFSLTESKRQNAAAEGQDSAEEWLKANDPSYKANRTKWRRAS